MTRWTGLILTLCLCATFVRADGGQPLPLFEVAGQHNRVWILGSIHLLRDSDLPLPAEFDRVYEQAEALVMELDLAAVDPLTMLATTRHYAIDPDGRSLAQLLGPQAYATAKQRAEAVELPLAMVDQVEPWFATITLTQVMLQRLGFRVEHGLESIYLARAQADGKAMSGLETLAEQFAILDGLTPDLQKRFLLDSLADLGELEAQFEPLVAAWKSGDMEELEALTNVSLDDSALQAALVTRRNRRWADALEPLLANKDDYLVIVGAGHLGGRDGLVALLQKAGFDVQQLRRQQNAEAGAAR